MIVYHYLNAKFGLSALQNKRLKISTINNLNDPFEFISLNISEKEAREMFLSLRKKLADTFGIVSFSKTWQSTALWAHYGDKHQGICLGFEIPDSLATHIRYSTDRPKIEFKLVESLIAADDDEKLESIFDFFLYKSAEWSYEKEIRIYSALTTAEVIDSQLMYFKNFDENFILKEVYMGARTQLSKPLVEHLMAQHPQAELFKVKPSFETFDIIKQTDTEYWYQNSDDYK